MTDPTLRPVSASHVEWSQEADVVVAGLGVAGATAAIEAARAGADVLALERLGGGGGAAAMSGGFIYLGGGTALQKSLGFDDSVENMKAFMKAALGPGVDEAKVDVYCEGSVEHYDWLVDAGVVFDESFWGEPGWEPPHGEGLMYSGGENSAPFNTTIPPAPRGHLPRRAAAANGEQAGGYMLMKPLLDLVDELGVRTLYNNSIRSLVVDDDGRGVAPGDRERVFARFVRLDEARERDSGGAGLGLAIAREVARELGGDVHLEDAPRGGARAVLDLPEAVAG